jgi:hypothetical protein
MVYIYYRCGCGMGWLFQLPNKWFAHKFSTIFQWYINRPYFYKHILLLTHILWVTFKHLIEMMGSCKYFPHFSKMPTLTYSAVDSFLNWRLLHLQSKNVLLRYVCLVVQK